ncbi:hypothetical protein FRB98_001595, partial [Tulasnella sp. 332]
MEVTKRGYTVVKEDELIFNPIRIGARNGQGISQMNRHITELQREFQRVPTDVDLQSPN